jgi:hypothetical protein
MIQEYRVLEARDNPSTAGPTSYLLLRPADGAVLELELDPTIPFKPQQVLRLEDRLVERANAKRDVRAVS